MVPSEQLWSVIFHAAVLLQQLRKQLDRKRPLHFPERRAIYIPDPDIGANAADFASSVEFLAHRLKSSWRHAQNTR